MRLEGTPWIPACMGMTEEWHPGHVPPLSPEPPLPPKLSFTRKPPLPPEPRLPRKSPLPHKPRLPPKPSFPRKRESTSGGCRDRAIAVTTSPPGIPA